MAKGLVSCFLNRQEAAIEALEHAMRLSPLEPLGNVFAQGLAGALLFAGRYEEALEWAEQSLCDHPGYVAPWRLKVALLMTPSSDEFYQIVEAAAFRVGCPLVERYLAAAEDVGWPILDEWRPYIALWLGRRITPNGPAPRL
jgi:tetratricopeptide (TPR) repeat protein